MSIFAKDCPQCGETNPAYAVRCRCGFAFGEVDHDTEGEVDTELALEEEKLYQEYLAARAQQAATAANDAAKLASAQPANTLKIKEAEQAKATADGAEAELKAQRTKLITTMRGPGTPQTPQPTTLAKVNSSEAPSQASTSSGSTIAPRQSAAPIDASTTQKPVATSKSPAVQSNLTSTRETQVARTQAAAAPSTSKVASVTKSPTVAESMHPKASTKSGVDLTQNTTPMSANTGPIHPATQGPRLNDEGSTAAPPGSSATPSGNANKEVDATTRAAAAARAKKLEEMLRAAKARRAAKLKAAPSPGAERSAPTTSASPAVRSTATPDTTPVPDSRQPQPAALASDAQPQLETTAKPTEPPQKTSALDQWIPTDESTDEARLGELEDNTDTTSEVELTNDDAGERPDGAPSSEEKSPDAVSQSRPADDMVTASAAAPAVNPSETAKTDTQEELRAALKALEARAPEPATDEKTETAEPVEASLPADETPQDPAADIHTPAAAKSTEDASSSSAPVVAAAPEASNKQDMKDCPNCTALLPLHARQCGCGFEFPTADEKIPSLSLSDSDVAALDSGVKSSGVTHLG